MTQYEKNKRELTEHPKTWLVTGVAGFIGSNLLEALLKLDQTVIGLDNFSTGFQSNLDDVKNAVTKEQWNNFTFLKGDIRDPETCKKACESVEYILHQAALCSVEQSIHDPILTSTNNINGFLNILVAARDTGVKRLVYASSCAIYGDCEEIPLAENSKGSLLSPYAADKYINEVHADTFFRAYNLNSIGLRYFNVFGPHQNIDTTYGSVIPRWFYGLISGEDVFINGDGKTTRDFLYIKNIIQANILAACAQNPDAINNVYNIGTGDSTDLNELFELIKGVVSKTKPDVKDKKPLYRDFRPGDVRHSQADISKARDLLGYEPEFSVQRGLEETAKWYLEMLS